MARHFKDVPFVEDGDDGLEAIDVPSHPVAKRATYDETGSRVTRPVAGNFSTGDTTGFVAVVSEPDAKNAKRKYQRRTHGKAHYAETDPYDIHGYRSKGKGRKAARIVSTVLFVVGVLLLLAAGGMWLKAQWDYHQQDVEIERLSTYATVSEQGDAAPTVDWGKLRAVNNDAVGWVQIPGTPVNFPVYQGADNDEYLHTNAEGEYSLGGQVFLDFENTAPGMVDNQTIVYGHHLRNGAMFKAVADMDNQAFFDSIQTVWYVTQDGAYELAPLMCYYADPYDTTVRTFTFDTVEEFRNYLGELFSRAVTFRADADAVISNADHVFSLVTCNYLDEMDGDGRTIVVCVPKNELPQ